MNSVTPAQIHVAQGILQEYPWDATQNDALEAVILAAQEYSLVFPKKNDEL